MTRHIWTDEEKEYLVKITPGHHYKEILDLMNEKFDKTFTLQQIKNAINRYKLNTGFTGHFEEGNIPHNKGKKIEEYMSKEGIENAKKTRFKKGHKPAIPFPKGYKPSNTRPIGSERINQNGFIEIKVAESGRWRKKHIVLWEEANGKVPEDYVLIFLDRNKQNITLENLQLVKKTELLIMGAKHLLKDNAELTKTGVILAKLINKTYELKKE